jgi:hypothetical protein
MNYTALTDPTSLAFRMKNEEKNNFQGLGTYKHNQFNDEIDEVITGTVTCRKQVTDNATDITKQASHTCLPYLSKVNTKICCFKTNYLAI